ncbi:hypothetical protein, partial [Stenotrophomonas sp.]|uniref:hypothetical protein n=1 Tax=Stenotrophomonas sp. TaxID=69392 RepID=UPI0028A9140F
MSQVNVRPLFTRTRAHNAHPERQVAFAEPKVGRWLYRLVSRLQRLDRSLGAVRSLASHSLDLCVLEENSGFAMKKR